jgi:hypothetical protein
MAREKFTSPYFDKYTKSNQKRWNEFSQETVSLLAQKLQLQRPSAKELMLFLGDRRQAVAKELNHDPERQEYFGKMRYDVEYRGGRIVEDFITRDKFFAPILNVLKPYLPNNEYFQGMFNKYHPPNESKWSFSDLNNNLKISYEEFEHIRVLYPYPTDEMYDQLFKKIDQYIDQLLSWKTEDGIEEFLKTAAYLAYDCYRFLPFRLGTSAITNWLVRGIAEAKGIEIGPENKNSELPVDLRAFFTLEKEKYAEWYIKEAYVNVREVGVEKVVAPDETSTDATIKSKMP